MELWRRWWRPPERAAAAGALYDAAVARARAPVFYRTLAVPDTLDGRFELIALHVALVLRRLKAVGAEGAALGQDLFDLMMDDMDRNLREMGAGDLGVGPRVRRMASALMGRVAAYDGALAGGDLAAALRRNVWGTLAELDAALPARLADYVQAAAAGLDGIAPDALLAGRVDFAAPPPD